MEIKASGKICMVSSRCSRVWVGLTFRFGDVFPACVDRNMCSEYVAVISIESPSMMMVVGHQLNKDVRIINSPVKLMLGGMAMFIRLAVSHQAVIIGRMLWNPRVSIRIRVCVRSYVMLARQNNIDEVKPWAIIRAIAPAMAHWVWIMIAAITRPMWLIDEYAIRDFRSVCCRHVRLARIAPHSDRIRNGMKKSVFVVGMICIMRMMP